MQNAKEHLRSIAQNLPYIRGVILGEATRHIMCLILVPSLVQGRLGFDVGCTAYGNAFS